MPFDPKLTRRGFVNVLLGGGVAGWLASLLYPVVKYLIPPEDVAAEPDVLKIGAKGEFPAGSSKIVKFGKRPIIFIHTPSGEFLALAATCTHLDCIVQYRKDMGAIWCACHNGKYDLNGRNISGPPPKPLEQYQVKVIQDDIFV